MVPRSAARSSALILRRRLFQDHTVTEIPEPFARSALRSKARQQRPQFRFDLLILHRLLVDAIEPRAALIASKVELVFAWRLPNKTDLRHVRPGAPIRAPR